MHLRDKTGDAPKGTPKKRSRSRHTHTRMQFSLKMSGYPHGTLGTSMYPPVVGFLGVVQGVKVRGRRRQNSFINNGLQGDSFKIR